MDLLTVLLIVAGVVAVYFVVKGMKKEETNTTSVGTATGKPVDNGLVQTFRSA